MKRQKRPIQLAGALLAALLATAGCATTTPTPSPSQTQPTDPLATRLRVPTFGPDVVAAAQEALAREGVATIAGSSVLSGSPGTPLTALTGTASPLQLMDEQVRAMALDAWSGAGIDGSALDSLVAVPDGAAPPSLLLAAYVDLGYTADATTGARLAASLVGSVDGSAAASTPYPLIVQALLVADMTQGTSQGQRTQIRLADFTSAPCTAVANFVDNALSAVFNAVKSNDTTFLAKLWNMVVTIGQGVVTALIKTLTAPLVEAVTKIIAVVGVVVQVVSFLRPWTLSIAPDDGITRFSVGNESSIDEAVRLSVDLGGLDAWPPLLVNCASAAGFTLPNLKPEGAPVTWSTRQFPDPLFSIMPLVTATSTLNDSLGVNGATTLRLETGHEDSQTAEGDKRFGHVSVSATVHRPGLDALKQGITNLIVGGLPGIVRNALAGILSGPINTAVAQLDALTDESGNTQFGVTYHEPKETPPPSNEPSFSLQPSLSPLPSSRPRSTPRPRPSVEPKGGPDPCASGCAESVGDPHLQTLDGREYDFQAAGEYTLLRSADGTMEIQARQVPYPQVADVSINTALAWLVSGHRVAAYGSGDGYSLTLDGAALGPDVGTRDLGGGASLTALADGVEVAYPDGTIATAVSHGGGFEGALDIEVAPSDTFRAQAGGLLAPIATGSELPAMPDGTALPLSADRQTRYHQRYEVLGPAWHVTPQTSLFAYGPGESTATFDVPGFPSSNVAFDINEFEARMSVDAVQQATEQCAGVGGDQKLVVKCIFDILATNNPAFAQVYQLLNRFLTDGPDGLEECRPPDAPAGFAVTPCIDSLQGGEALGSDGTLYAGIFSGPAQEAVAIDPATGKIVRSWSASGTADVALVAGSLWVTSGRFVNASAVCALDRLDPATFRKQASISLPCEQGGLEPDMVASSDAIWIVDGSSVSRVDVTANQLGSGVPLPVATGSGELLATGQVIYDGSLSERGHWWSLGQTDAAFTDLGNIDGFGDGVAGGGALWVPGFDGAKRYMTSGTADATIAIDGTLAGADDRALYVARDDSSTGHSELWRYPLDGSPPSQIAENDVSVQLEFGSANLGYSDNAQLVFDDGRLMATWLMRQGTAAVLYMQPITLPQ